MNIVCQVLGLCISLTCLLNACSPSVEPAFDTEQRYRHELYSPDECARISQSNAEFNCSETVQFNPDGTAYLLLGGGDVIVSGKYQRKGQKLTIQPSAGLPKEIVFKIVSDGELRRVDNTTTWRKW